MKKMDDLLQKYGLQWQHDSKTVLYMKIWERTEGEALSLTNSTASNDDIFEIVCKVVTTVFAKEDAALVVSNAQHFIEKNGPSPNFSALPAMFQTEMSFDMGVQNNEIIARGMVGNKLFNVLTNKASSEEKNEFNLFLQKRRTEENRLKIIFDSEKEAEVLQKENIQLLGKLEEELTNGNSVKDFKKEFIHLLEMYIKEALQKKKIAIE